MTLPERLTLPNAFMTLHNVFFLTLPELCLKGERKREDKGETRWHIATRSNFVISVESDAGSALSSFQLIALLSVVTSGDAACRSSSQPRSYGTCRRRAWVQGVGFRVLGLGFTALNFKVCTAESPRRTSASQQENPKPSTLLSPQP